MLIQLAQIEENLRKQNDRMKAFDKRMDLTIKRMVKAEARLEQQEKRMETFDKKLEQSLKDQRDFSRTQTQLNKYFLDAIKKMK